MRGAQLNVMVCECRSVSHEASATWWMSAAIHVTRRSISGDADQWVYRLRAGRGTLSLSETVGPSVELRLDAGSENS